MAQQSMFQIGSTLSDTVSNTAVDLSDIGFSADEIAAADVAEISVEGEAIRRSCGVDAPTDTVGHPHEAGETFQIVSKPLIRNLKLIRRDSSDATVQVSLYRW